TATTDAGHDVDDEPLTLDEASPPKHPSFIQTEDETSISTGGRRSGFIDLGVDEISQGDHAGSLVFSNIEETPAAPEIEELESRVADNPDDPEAHQALGEALIEQGARERGIEELDLPTARFGNTGDEEQDFQDMLTRCKQGIDENIDEADFQSHYDLGVAFKEMGLIDEAIAELQKALRAPEGKLRTSEMLGVCFFEKGAYGVAESILRRGLDLSASGDQERLGVLYWLGRALEQQGKKADARDLYGRVFAVDIRFLDAEQRVKALAKA